jgi:Family of unknown function (DUF5336)
MTPNSDAPDDAPARAGSRSRKAQPETPRPETSEPSSSGPVAELALVAAGLGLVVYLLGFVTDIGLGTLLYGPLLIGGGLLAGSVVLPAAGPRVLVPAAVATTTGALLLLQVVVDGRDSPVAIGALVLAVLQAAAAVGAALLQAGVVRAPRPRPKKAVAVAPPSAFPGYPQQPGYPQFPGQQYPGQPYPGAYPGPGQPAQPYPGDQYAGEHAYAQQARYGAQYGVPGYPPPPPYATPGYGPAGYGVPAYGRSGVPAPDPTADPATVAVPFGAARPAAETAPDEALPASPPVPSSGVPSSGVPSSGPPDVPVEGSAAHRAPGPEPAGSHRVETPASGGPRSDDGGAAERDDQDRTRAIPTVPGERPPT